MRKIIKYCSVFFLAITILVGCGNRTSAQPVRIGSKNFTESLLIAEIYTLALEDNGIPVERIPNISGSLTHTSIVNDEIDLYPEYTGTALLSILDMPMETDPDQVYQIVKEEYNQRYDITWLNYAEMNNSQGLVIRTDVAEELAIETISDLQKNADKLRFASQGEFNEREDGLPGLEEKYGEFDWASMDIYDNSLKYIVLDSDEADVTPAYTTDGQLVDEKTYKVLEDDKKFWPPYNLAPVVRNEALNNYPEMAVVLNTVNEYLDTKTVIALNAAVDVEGEEYEVVAGKFYELIKPEIDKKLAEQ